MYHNFPKQIPSPSVGHNMYCNGKENVDKPSPPVTDLLHMPHQLPFKEKGQWRAARLRPTQNKFLVFKKKKKVKPETLHETLHGHFANQYFQSMHEIMNITSVMNIAAILKICKLHLSTRTANSVSSFNVIFSEHSNT